MTGVLQSFLPKVTSSPRFWRQKASRKAPSTRPRERRRPTSSKLKVRLRPRLRELKQIGKASESSQKPSATVRTQETTLLP